MISYFYDPVALYHDSDFGTDEVACTEVSRLLSIPVSAGELIDKITILEIKAERIGDPAKLANVRHELSLLRRVRDRAFAPSVELDRLSADLKKANEALWCFEDYIRTHEDDSLAFGIVPLARRIYETNDHRATLKRGISRFLKSEIVEEKSHLD